MRVGVYLGDSTAATCGMDCALPETGFVGFLAAVFFAVGLAVVFFAVGLEVGISVV
ncbi:MAG: hypothetical protein MJ083_04540 [Clostridia bacterium]|nr:hypothetical protein [Clostridia bacterium]